MKNVKMQTRPNTLPSVFHLEAGALQRSLHAEGGYLFLPDKWSGSLLGTS
jgi:hypothetical protein